MRRNRDAKLHHHVVGQGTKPTFPLPLYSNLLLSHRRASVTVTNTGLLGSDACLGGAALAHMLSFVVHAYEVHA
jgi:hypothetical protein